MKKRKPQWWLYPLRQWSYLTEERIKKLREETEAIRREAEILKRQNKSLALIEEIGLSSILDSATISSIDENGETIKSLDIPLLAKTLVQIGCNQKDIPVLLQSLELTKS